MPKRLKILGFKALEVGSPYFLLKKGFSDYLELLSQNLGIPTFITYLVGTALAIIIIEIVLWIKSQRFKKRKVFTVEDREKDDFKKHVTSLIKDSRTIHFMLLSGYTMFWEGSEKFILEELQKLSPEERAEKDIKILMLHPESDNWERRAKVFVRRMKKESGGAALNTIAEYKERCAKIIKNLESLGAKILFYDFEPHWRIHIFDQVLFVSFYGAKKDGNLTTLYCFEKNDENSIYHGFTKFFNWYWKWAYSKTDPFPRKIRCESCGHETPYVRRKRPRTLR